MSCIHCTVNSLQLIQSVHTLLKAIYNWMIVGGSFNYNLNEKNNIDSDDYQQRSAYIKH